MIKLEDTGDVNFVVGRDQTYKALYARLHCSYYPIIDFFEGIHYSKVRDTLQCIIDENLDVSPKVFICTHSKDAIEALPSLIKNNPDLDFQVIRAGVSARNSNKGEFITTIFDSESILDCVLQNIEMR